MPVTEFQREVLRVLAALRTPGSHFAGSLPLHIQPDSLRYSHDFDIFHDAGTEVIRASEADAAALAAAGFTLDRLGLWTGTFRKARLGRLGCAEVLEIDLAMDAAVRFFPIIPDADLGWRLHPFDLATNKALALATRTVTRDVIDIVEWGRRYSLAAILWAACGKDPGYNPLMLLVMMRRFARVLPDELDQLAARKIDPVVLKTAWIDMAADAETDIVQLADAQPDIPIGVVFANASGDSCWLRDPVSPIESQGLRLHRATVGGCWPHVSGLD